MVSSLHVIRLKFYIYLSSPPCYMFHHFTTLDLMALFMFGEEYKSWIFSLCDFFHPPVTLSVLDQNIHLRTLFLNNPNITLFIAFPQQCFFFCNTILSRHSNLKTYKKTIRSGKLWRGCAVFWQQRITFIPLMCTFHTLAQRNQYHGEASQHTLKETLI